MRHVRTERFAAAVKQWRARGEFAFWSFKQGHSARYELTKDIGSGAERRYNSGVEPAVSLIESFEPRLPMTLTLETPPLPLQTDADNIVRVGGTRVTLETIATAFRNGATAEQIAQDFPVLQLADVYAVIQFYLRQREQVDQYLAERRAAGDAVRRQVESQCDPQGIRERLLARRTAP